MANGPEVRKASVVKTRIFFATVFINGTFVLQGGDPWTILDVCEVDTIRTRTSKDVRGRQKIAYGWLVAIGVANGRKITTTSRVNYILRVWRNSTSLFGDLY